MSAAVCRVKGYICTQQGLLGKARPCCCRQLCHIGCCKWWTDSCRAAAMRYAKWVRAQTGTAFVATSHDSTLPSTMNRFDHGAEGNPCSHARDDIIPRTIAMAARRTTCSKETANPHSSGEGHPDHGRDCCPQQCAHTRCQFEMQCFSNAGLPRLSPTVAVQRLIPPSSSSFSCGPASPDRGCRSWACQSSLRHSVRTARSAVLSRLVLVRLARAGLSSHLGRRFHEACGLDPEGEAT